MSGPVFALSVEVESMDFSQPKYSAISDTAAVKYFSKCSRDNLKLFEWKKYLDHGYAIRSYLQPIAILTVKREPVELLPNPQPLILRAIKESAKMGGNLICFVSLKRNMDGLGLDSITFRIYKQFLISQHTGWLQYYSEKMGKEGPLALPREE